MMLANGQCTAELTQMVSDPYFLQRRLALSSQRHLLDDMDACEEALELLVRRERFEQRYLLRLLICTRVLNCSAEADQGMPVR
jgi:hypothetical protein